MQLIASILGQIDYGEALALQERLVKMRRQELLSDVLLLLEHPPTLTLGAKADTSNILAPAEVLKANGVSIYKVNRGGDVTYHGPGQIVGYPIMDLKSFNRDALAFFRKIEETFIQLLKSEYGIAAGRSSHYPGVWCNGEKITAIGCSLHRWVTMHGFAFNVNTNLDHFKWINPCGLTGKGVTSLQKILGCPQDLSRVYIQVLHYFSAVFDVRPQVVDKKSLYRLAGSG